MVEIFPEIETFFEQEQFTQEQLDNLKSQIDGNYGDGECKLANSIIDNRLSKYKSFKNQLKQIELKGKRKRIKRRNKKAASSLIKKNRKKIKVEVLHQETSNNRISHNPMKIIKRVKRSDHRKKNPPGVYGKLLKVKSIGSIIYTRMS